MKKDMARPVLVQWPDGSRHLGGPPLTWRELVSIAAGVFLLLVMFVGISFLFGVLA